MQALMFIARGLSVALAVFVLLYVALSLLVSRIWAPVAKWTSSLSARRIAGILFFLRLLPLLVSSVVTFAITLPSFLLLEPLSTDEEIGIAPLILGLCCLALIVVGVRRAIMAQRKTSQALAGWLKGANRIESNISIPVFQTAAHSPSLTVAGVCTPVVLVSESAVALLNEREFQTALRHEIAHVASRDNFKKLLFRVTSFPGMAGLETAWSDAAEMSADDAAVSSLNDALDLAAALIKLSRLAPVQPTAVLTTALLQSSSASLSARVQRLFAWNSRLASADGPASRILLPSLLGTLFCLAVSYGYVLAGMHAATEWLVR